MLGINICNAQSLNSFADIANNGSEIIFEFKALDNKNVEVYRNEGTIIIYNDNYRMLISNDLLVIDNGIKRFIYKEQDDEIIIAPVNKNEEDIMENPFAILRYKKSRVGNYNIEAKFGADKSIPQKIILKADNGAEYIITIKKFKDLKDISSKLFEYNLSEYPDAIVTNLD